ncbi:structural maintenance of chromosomes protein 6B isoform X1 [Gossypium hirsutum]|uniref:Structural maintenance of chromosomes protein 6B isoform X1 n=2 Tax=Gossypium TaxID=3633 RepID=A0A1U8M6D4_GOSHI|nr:structural maintenance of chromosomes protein 6B isoform X1 [Gossypium hirsutum]
MDKSGAPPFLSRLKHLPISRVKGKLPCTVFVQNFNFSVSRDSRVLVVGRPQDTTMSSSRVFSGQMYGAQRSGAGTIRRIRLENFMCHSSLEIELGEWVNFITGQNGSGKSAILTALCIAFGCRARETQRASKLKEFIKTGCSYATVQVDIKNEGVDSFKPEIFGDTIIIERRISDTTSSTVLKDRQGRKVASRKEDLRELVEHFNIDVENPCVIMSQDKSREFLHSGNDRDKFKFFFKATLLQQVDELLQSIIKQLKDACALVDELEKLIRPAQLELSELQEKIENIKRVEQILQEVQLLRKKLAWSLVYDEDKRLQEQAKNIETLKKRIPTCQAKIDSTLDKLEKLLERLSKKKVQVASLVEKTSEVKRKKDELWDALCSARKEKLELEEEHRRGTKQIHKMRNDVRRLEEQARDIQDKHIRNTQAEESEIEEQIKELEYAVDNVQSLLSSLKDEENTLSEQISAEMDAMKKINDEINYYERKQREVHHQICELRLHQTNKVTAFGGDGVLRLLREIERHHKAFSMPPIGPIGAHVTLVNGDTWAPAVERAIGKMLNAFIVTNSEDACALRKCAREARYNFFPIVIQRFSRPRLIIPNHSLPQTSHPTTLSVLHSDNPTIYNVLVDVCKAERQVLVKDYNMGRAVAFDQRIPNMLEVFTLDGFKMFSRGSVQTVLPINKNLKIGRLRGSFGDQVKEFESHVSNIQQDIDQRKSRKRELEKKVQDFNRKLDNKKKRRLDVEREFMAKRMKLQDMQKSHAVDASLLPESTTNELLQEISDGKMVIKKKEALLEALKDRINEAEEKARTLKLSFEDLGESTKGEVEAFQKAEEELTEIEKEIHNAEANKLHYENIMNNKVLPQIKEAEAKYLELEKDRKESYKKASVICPESDIEALGDRDETTTEQLDAKLKRLNQRLMHESQQYSESIDDLRMLHQEKERRILRELHTYKAFRERLDACQKALDLRWKKFQRSASLLRRELTWQFNGHLGKKGISGHINVSYEEKTLSVEVKMPQDASSTIVRDTRGLSGGERSFSTLCFALALHDMTEAPFRAMDEFDVFMDAVSRKISLDTLVEFALAQGSQWIFITPHDISNVKNGERIKKQQMAAPRL